MCPPIVHTLWQELALVREQRHYKLQYSAIPFPSCCQHKCPTLRLHHDWTFWHQQPIKLNWLKDKIQAWLMMEIKLLFFFLFFFQSSSSSFLRDTEGIPSAPPCTLMASWLGESAPAASTATLPASSRARRAASDWCGRPVGCPATG